MGVGLTLKVWKMVEECKDMLTVNRGKEKTEGRKGNLKSDRGRNLNRNCR
jgi:hypothetical protein